MDACTSASTSNPLAIRGWLGMGRRGTRERERAPRTRRRGGAARSDGSSSFLIFIATTSIGLEETRHATREERDAMVIVTGGSTGSV
eukprot:scaffold135243_cov34-Tisochrysis_lutea.AAC.3